MISAVAAAGPVKAAAVWASVVVAAVGGGETAADVDVVTNARHTQITLISLPSPEFHPGQVGMPWVYVLTCLAVTRRRPWWQRKKRPELQREEHESNCQQCSRSEYEL